MAKIIGNTTATPLMVDDKISLDSKNPIQNKAVACALGKKIELKGDVEENSLPTENNIKGDVYRLYEKDNISTTEKYLLSGKYIYNEWQPVNDELQSGWGFSFYEDLLADGEDMSVHIPVNIYDTSHNILGTGELYFKGEISLWTFETQTIPLTENETYYIERTDGKTPAYLESTTIEEFEKIIKGYAIYNGESFDRIYTARGLENIIKEITNSSLNFKGNIKEDKLPTDGNALGDVYKIFTDVPAEKQYIQVDIRHDENVQCYYGSLISDTETYLYTSEEYDRLVSNGYFDVFIDCDVYDTEWNYVCTSNMSCRNDCGGWCMGGELASGLELGSTYYIVRADNLSPMDTSLPTYSALDIEYTGYAIYNGESFDKFYNDETVDNKIANIAENFDNKLSDIEEEINTKADVDKWELIDTITTTEDVTSLRWQNEPDGTPYNFKKMKVFVTIPSGGSGNAYFNMVKRGTNGAGGNSSVAYYLLTHKNAYADFYIENGLGFIKTRSGTGDYSQYTNASGGIPMDYFYDLRVNGNGKILTGTTFEIWGVRNK